MIVKKLSDILGTSDEVHDPNKKWTSRRLLLAKDNMGFSLHDTVIYAGSEIEMCYQNHLEAVYCVQGQGEILDLATGKLYDLNDGTVYALDNHDKHILRAKTKMRMVCVFNPPVTGKEVHDASGAYPLVKEQEV